MIEDLDMGDYYPIDAAIEGGVMRVVATAYNRRDGDEYQLELSGLPIRRHWREAHAIARWWLRGLPVQREDGTTYAPPAEACITRPLKLGHRRACRHARQEARDYGGPMAPAQDVNPAEVGHG